jgi:hypothetical protein
MKPALLRQIQNLGIGLVSRPCVILCLDDDQHLVPSDSRPESRNLKMQNADYPK